MSKLIGLGAGAGLVSALLFAVVATGSPAGMVLCYAAPLPVIIVSLGWSHLLGLLAVAVAGVATSLALTDAAALAYAAGPGLPAWLLSFALLGGLGFSRTRQGETGPVGGVPPGHLLALVALLGAAVALVSAFSLGNGDFATYRGLLKGVAESLLRVEAGSRRGALPSIGGIAANDLVLLLIRIAPAVAASVFSLALALNLWLGAKAVALSGRLPCTWPPVPEMRMPPAALAACAAGFVMLFLPGFVGVAGTTLLGAFLLAFALQGLALLHHVTRGRKARGPLLTFAYMLTIFFGGTFLPLMALAGMADTATPLRRRLLSRAAKKASSPPKPPSPSKH